MRTLIKIGFGLLLLAFALIALSYNALRSGAQSGPANPAGRLVATEERKVGSGIEGVELSGPINMTLRQGAIASLTVRGEQRLLGNVETVQEGRTLHIGPRGMLFHHRQPLEVELVLPTLARLNVNGSGDSTINGFSGDQLEVQLHGSGNVIFNGRFRNIAAGLRGTGDLELNGGNSEKVSVELVGSGQMTVVGACKEFKAAQTGSGDLDAKHLSADKVAIDLHGSGTSNVQAKQTAAVTLHGSGDVNVYGQPHDRNVNKSGSGDVVWKD